MFKLLDPVYKCVFDVDFSCKFSKLLYNSLAFAAGFKRGTDYGSLPEIAQYSPYYRPLNVLLLPNDKIFIFYLIQINKHLQYTFWCSFLIFLALFFHVLESNFVLFET